MIDDAGKRHAPGLPRTQALTRAAELLRAVAQHPLGSTDSALARATGLPRPTVARTLATLADAGLVERSPSGEGWALGYELVRLGRAADPHGALLSTVRPVLEQLLHVAQESVTLGVPLAPIGVEILLQLDAPHLIGVTNWVGRTFPLHASGAGKIVLAELSEDELSGWLESVPLESCTERTIVDSDDLRAELERVRRRGYAESVDELEPGLSGIGAGMRGAGGELVAIIGVSGPSFRLTATRRKGLVSPIMGAVTEIGRLVARES